jgi:hypothetical protein
MIFYFILITQITSIKLISFLILYSSSYSLDFNQNKSGINKHDFVWYPNFDDIWYYYSCLLNILIFSSLHTHILVRVLVPNFLIKIKLSVYL